MLEMGLFMTSNFKYLNYCIGPIAMVMCIHGSTFVAI